jgi:hypothetical protein
MTSTSKVTSSLLALIIPVWAFSQDPLLGRWDLTVEGPDGKYPSWIEIRKSGRGTWVGSYVGQFGSARPIAKIHRKGDAFEFSVPPQWEPGSTDFVIEGKLTQGKLQGTIGGDRRRKLSWSAVRAPGLTRLEKPKWGMPVNLLEGDSLSHWKPRTAGRPNGWKASNGILSNAKPGNDLVSVARFHDFQLVAEFRYPKGSNSGIYLRGRYEVQIEDNHGEEPECHKIGGIYGFLTPSVNAAKPAGEWQNMEITLVGRSVTIMLNGNRIVDRQAIPGPTGGALDSNEAEAGPIMLQGDHGPIEFRKLIVTPAESP